MPNIQFIPAGALVLMVGSIASGKSHYAREIADEIGPGALVSVDDLRDQVYGRQVHSAPQYIHGVARSIVEARMAVGAGVVYDATNLLPRDRAGLISLAKSYGAAVWAIHVTAPTDIAWERNLRRESDRVVPRKVFDRMAARAKQVSARVLRQEGADHVVSIDSQAIDHIEDLGERLMLIPGGWDKSVLHTGDAVTGFDVIGDIHGCLNSFEKLLEELGYDLNGRHPDGRMLVSVGDIVDRGPHTWDVTTKIMDMVNRGHMLVNRGNHESKHGRYLAKMVKAERTVTGGGEEVVLALAESQGGANGLTRALLEALDRGDVDEWERRSRWMAALPNHIVLNDGALLVTHGAARADLIGRGDRGADSWFLYGAPTGEKDSNGYPVRADWQPDWDGDAFVVVGHDIVEEPRWGTAGGGSINVDTNCSGGGRLTAIRWPEKAIVSVETEPGDLAGMH